MSTETAVTESILFRRINNLLCFQGKELKRTANKDFGPYYVIAAGGRVEAYRIEIESYGRSLEVLNDHEIYDPRPEGWQLAKKIERRLGPGLRFRRFRIPQLTCNFGEWSIWDNRNAVVRKNIDLYELAEEIGIDI